jgi:hypothetical protein
MGDRQGIMRARRDLRCENHLGGVIHELPRVLKVYNSHNYIIFLLLDRNLATKYIASKHSSERIDHIVLLFKVLHHYPVTQVRQVRQDQLDRQVPPVQQVIRRFAKHLRARFL